MILVAGNATVFILLEVPTHVCTEMTREGLTQNKLFPIYSMLYTKNTYNR